MYVVRPAELADSAQLVALGERSGAGPGRAHRMPVGRAAIEAAIERSLASFAAQVDAPGDQSYLLVLAHSGDAVIEGCASISALAGSGCTYFAFRRDVLRQVSVELQIAHEMRALTMSSDLSRHSHLGACYVGPGTGARPAALLARARLMLAAAAPQRFAAHFFASLPGATLAGKQPFWNAVGSQFFDIPLTQLEAILGERRNHPAMVEMMPHYPLYVDLLAPDAQAALGSADDGASAVRRALDAEGFHGGRYVGLLDGGALLHAKRGQLRSFAPAARHLAGAGLGATAPHIVASTRAHRFRAVLDPGDAAGLCAASMGALGVGSTDEVLSVEL